MRRYNTINKILIIKSHNITVGEMLLPFLYAQKGTKMKEKIKKLLAGLKEGVRAIIHVICGEPFLIAEREEEGRPIVYQDWSGRRNSAATPAAGKKRKQAKAPESTVVLLNYKPPKEAHHHSEPIEYAIGKRSCKGWTKDEVERLESLLEAGMPSADIAEELGRSLASTRCKISYIRRKAKD